MVQNIVVGHICVHTGMLSKLHHCLLLHISPARMECARTQSCAHIWRFSHRGLVCRGICVLTMASMGTVNVYKNSGLCRFRTIHSVVDWYDNDILHLRLHGRRPLFPTLTCQRFDSGTKSNVHRRICSYRGHRSILVGQTMSNATMQSRV